MSILKGNNEKMAASGNTYYVVFVSYIRVTQSLLYVAGWFRLDIAFFSAFHLLGCCAQTPIVKNALRCPRGLLGEPPGAMRRPAWTLRALPRSNPAQKPPPGFAAPEQAAGVVAVLIVL